MLADQTVTQALEHLKAQRKKLDLAIKALEVVLQGTEEAERAVATNTIQGPSEMRRRSGTMRRLKPSVSYPAIKILRETGAPIKTAALYKMIVERGGKAATINSLYTTLKRQEGIKLLEPGTWGLEGVQYEESESGSDDAQAALIPNVTGGEVG